MTATTCNVNEIAKETGLRLNGTSFAGCWMVYTGSDNHDGFGPFADVPATVDFMTKVGAPTRRDLYAVNLSDYPHWHNV